MISGHPLSVGPVSSDSSVSPVIFRPTFQSREASGPAFVAFEGSDFAFIADEGSGSFLTGRSLRPFIPSSDQN